ncbi:MAG: molecular chaperone DnaK [Deltaproteobacteria bacterium]|nr:molecular chaperone DnaK [Deltaproteobacteria bacterium]
MASNKVIGIDLGTTNSCVAVMENGAPRVIPNKGGYKTTPSVIAAAENGRRLVGQIAKRQAVTNAENTVYAAKRIIGRKWGHPAVETARHAVPYAIVEGPHGDVRVRLRGRDHSIPELSGAVLAEMKKVAEDFLGEPVEKAVITIPAYFNDGQRQATKDAGVIAGLDVIRIINEPTAAALAFGFGKKLQKTVCVFDLGGGTFDISILDIGDGVYEVVCAAGDTFLGGEDFDNRVIDWLAFGFMKDQNVDLRQDRMALQRLKDAAETAKCELSTADTTSINLPFIITPPGGGEALHLQTTLPRQKLEELTADLVDRCIQITDRALKDAGLTVKDIGDVLLVGGMTRMPIVQHRVEEFFKRSPNKGVHPDEVVALGAAVQGAALMEQEAGKKPDMLLLDVTSHNLGIMVAGGYLQTLIEANTTVPCSASHLFTTVRDNQTQVKIVVLQGNERRAEDNEVLGEFLLTGLRDAPRGQVTVEVTFEINSDGIVSVHARDTETGAQQSITVTTASALTDDEMKGILEANKAEALASKSRDQTDQTRLECERLLRDIDKLWPEAEKVFGATEAGKATLRNSKSAVEKARADVAGGDKAALQETLGVLQRTHQLVKGAAR